jgi:hypothetical protein
VGGQRHAPAALPPGMTRYPLYRRLGGPQGRSGQVLKISPPPGFDPQTVQLVASRYTGCAIPAYFVYNQPKVTIYAHLYTHRPLQEKKSVLSHSHKIQLHLNPMIFNWNTSVTGHKQVRVGFPQRKQLRRSTANSSVSIST